ncbi:MAG: diacylglycerol kinase family protein [Bacteroides sp.]|nr:diacylglycerol kinase family protein [Bacteroides sp.]
MGIKKRIKSFGYAWRGLSGLILKETNARIHTAAAILVVICGFILDLSASDWCLVVLCIGSVLAAEGFNAAIEKLVDLVSPDYHPLAGKAKDIAAGAVLITAIAAAIVGFVIFIPKIS